MSTPLPALPVWTKPMDQRINEVMQQYGRACARAALERAAAECEKIEDGCVGIAHDEFDRGQSVGAEECRARIRTLAKEYE